MRTLRRAFLRSRVARRIVALFVLCALVPIIATAIISLTEVQKLLVDQAHVRLAQANEGYAAGLLDRLLTMNQETADIVDRLAGNALRSSEVVKRMHQHFTAVTITDAAGQARSLFGPAIVVSGPDEVGVERLAQGKTALFSIARESGAARTFLRRAIDASNPRGGSIIAEIDPDYLWGEDAALPAATDVCVSDEHGRLLYCSKAALSEGADGAGGHDGDAVLGRFTFVHSGEMQLADRRELFLRPYFLVRGWSVLSVKPEAEALKPLTAFRTLFLPIIALALFVVSLLSVVQIRRTLGPLERLIAGTRRAADKDFATRVDVSTNDEFGELARAFNTMTTRLGNQFTALTTLAEIDRAILSRLDLERIVETVVLHMDGIVEADCVSIVIRDRDSPNSLRVFTREQRDGAGLTVERCEGPAATIDDLRFHTEGLWLDCARAAEPYLKPIGRLNAKSCCALPILWQEEVAGAVVLGFLGSVEPEFDLVAATRDLADRLGVAFAAAAKDEQLYFQANYDALTALPNRHFFKDHLARTIAQCRRDGAQLALLFIDLDHFKNINDALGHAAGDEVLRLTAQRLKQCVRDADTTARLGGDEFTIIATQVKTPRDAETIAQNVLGALRAPFVVANTEHFLSASIGIAVYPADGASADDLLRNADTAMFRAKDAGRDRFVYFEGMMNAANLAWMAIDRDLRYALERGELRIVYQPQKDIRTDRTVGAEALLRWAHPKRGLLTPPQFIDVAEATGQIEQIGDWVLHEACRQCRSWEMQGAQLATLAVNVSARQFRQDNFVERTETTVRRSGLNLDTLELEITESLLMETGRGIEQMLDRLRQLGVRLAIDDFGTGYSSLAYLKRFDVRTVKIDRAFVKGIPSDGGSAAIVKAIIAMAHALGKCVVAEGVETAAQYVFLVDAGCDLVQGYFVSPPLMPDEFLAFASAAVSTKPRKRIALA